MNDELEQLLRRADETAPEIRLDSTDLPNRLRRSAIRQRRAAFGGGLAIVLLALVPLLTLHRTLKPVAIAPKVEPAPAVSMASLEYEAALHEQTAALLEASLQIHKPMVDPRDEFLAELQYQRDRTALLLLNDANRKMRENDPVAAAAKLRRTVELFPETIAAARATQQLEKLESLRSEL